MLCMYCTYFQIIQVIVFSFIAGWEGGGGWGRVGELLAGPSVGMLGDIITTYRSRHSLQARQAD